MKRTILIYRDQPLPISETFVYNQCFKLQRYQAYILGAKWPKGPSIQLPEERVRVINEGSLNGWLQEFQWKVMGWVPKEILRWAKSLSPGLIHAHFGPDGVVVMPLAKKLGVPLLVSFHGTDATMKPSYVWRHSYWTHRLYWLRRKKLAGMVNRIIVQSNFLRDIVTSQHGMPAEKVTCIRHGVDLGEFVPGDSITEKRHVLYVGRLIERKGLPFLLRALSRLSERFPDLRLTVIGTGPMKYTYEAMAQELLGNRVKFLGAQPQAIVKDYLRRAYLFSMPSVTMPSGEAETLGVVFLESMAMKVPPVSFRSGGIPEVIVHGKTGFLAEERNIEELAHYLGILLENETLRHQMGEAGRRWVEQEFNLERQNAKLEALYDEVIEEYARRIYRK